MCRDNLCDKIKLISQLLVDIFPLKSTSTPLQSFPKIDIIKNEDKWMSKLNIANIIIKNRRRINMTQLDLAVYLGVSKAVVSKWENNQSFPDITLFPQLAALFNISIDELFGYSPQLTGSEIRDVCSTLSSEMMSITFEDSMISIQDAIKNYHSCYPFLYQVAAMLINHHASIPEKQRVEIFELTQSLTSRIVDESGDILLTREALNLQALSLIMLNKPDEVLALLGESIQTSSPYEGSLIAKAYVLKGNKAKAKEIHQCNLYNFQYYLIEAMVDYVQFLDDDFKTAQVALERTIALIDLFNVKELNPNVVAKTYLIAANLYLVHGDLEKGLSLFEKYVDFCITHFLPYKISGDEFFSEINEWLEEEESCEQTLDDRAIKEAMLNSIDGFPGFETLSENSRYLVAIKKLEDFVTGGESNN